MSAGTAAAIGSTGRLRVLTAMQLARLRTSWRPYLVVSSVMPLGIAILMRAVMNDDQITEFGPQIVAGNTVLAISMTAIVMLAQRVSWLKENGVLDFYSTLPVGRSSVMGSVLLSFAVFSLPGTVIVLTVGAVLYDLSLGALWMAVPVWALGSFALAGLGIALGLGAPDEQLAGMYSNLAMMAVLFLGVLPADRIPAWLASLRVVLPSTYAVDALKPGLQGSVTGRAVLDLIVLVGFGAVSFWAVRGPLWPRAE